MFGKWLDDMLSIITTGIIGSGFNCGVNSGKCYVFLVNYELFPVNLIVQSIILERITIV